MYRRRAPRGRRFLGRRGQSIILLVGFLVALMGGVAASITVGTVYFAQTRLQNAVDAAALAGAQSEMQGGSPTTNQGYLTQQNMPQAEVSVSNLTNPPNAVQALGKVTVPGSFASLFGIKQFTVRARGVAQITVQAPFKYALFEGARSTLSVSGDTKVYGDAHSNGNMALSGNNCITGTMTVGDTGSSVSGSEKCTTTFTQIPYVPMPNWTLAQVTPQNATVISGAGCNSIPQTLTGNYILYCNWNTSGQVTVDGDVLVEPGYSISISGQLVISGSFTVDNGSISISGGVTQDMPGQGAALAALNGGNISISGNSKIDGVLYAPGGSINLSGNQKVSGAVIGEYVNLSGAKTITYNVQNPPKDLPIEQVALIQ